MTDTTRRDFLKQASLVTGSSLLGAGALRGQAAKARRPNILLLFPDQHRWDWTPAHQRGAGADAQLHAPRRAWGRLRARARGVAGVRAVAHLSRQRPRVRPLRPEVERRELPHRPAHVLSVPARVGISHAGLRQDRPRHRRDDRRRGIGIDGKRFAHEWGFTDAINNGGKQAGSQIYLAEPVGPKDSYYVYLDSLTPPQGLICAEDFRKRGKPVKENQWGDTSPSPLDEEHYLDNWIARNGLSLLDSTTKDEPWFLVVNFAGPHPPLDIPKRLESPLPRPRPGDRRLRAAATATPGPSTPRTTPASARTTPR